MESETMNYSIGTSINELLGVSIERGDEMLYDIGKMMWDDGCPMRVLDKVLKMYDGNELLAALIMYCEASTVLQIIVEGVE